VRRRRAPDRLRKAGILPDPGGTVNRAARSGENAPVDGFEVVDIPGGRGLRHAGFASAGAPRHLFTMRPEEGAGLPTAEAALGSQYPEGARLAALNQVHGGRAVTADQALRSVRETGAPIEADGVAGNDPGAVLAIRTADCVPILLADPGGAAAGAAHAGWRGTLAGVAAGTVRLLESDFNARAERLVALLGPAIGPCCYVVGSDVAAPFAEAFGEKGVLRRAPGDAPRFALDLIEANRRALVAAGLARERIHATGLCTSCRRDLFPSRRAEGPPAGRLWSLIAPGA